MKSHNDMPTVQQQFNFHYPTSGSLRQPPGQRVANGEILALACIIHCRGVGVGRDGKWVCFLLPPKLVLKIPGISGPGGADIRDSHRQGGTLHDGAAGDGAALLSCPQGFLDPPGTGPPNSHPSPVLCRKSLGWELFVRLPPGTATLSSSFPLSSIPGELSASELLGSRAGGRGPPLGFGSCLGLELALSSPAATPHPRDLRERA